MKKFTAIIFSAAFILSAFITEQKENVLTKKEKKQGWILLFDGSTKNGWRHYQNRVADNWDVKNGELYCKTEGVTKRTDLITTEQYENYELMIDWKIDPKKNSGIIYMVTEENSASYLSGPEYQLIDDTGYPEKIQDKQYSGSNYDMHVPVSRAAKPAGEYNHTKIVINRGHVEHWLNGVKVVDYQLWTTEWEKLKSESKWKNVKSYGMSAKGYIALQDHGGGVYFRNIKLKPL
jgi:hypothetical protein